MGNAWDKDWEDNPRNGACSPNWGTNIICYLGVLGHESFSGLNLRDRKDIVRTYNHLKKCYICREGYIYFLEVISSNEGVSAGFSQENFRILKENEKLLEKLVRKD